jgi:hypothetical protein
MENSTLLNDVEGISTGTKMTTGAKKRMAVSYQEAEVLIRSYGHSVSRRKGPNGLINTIVWIVFGEVAHKEELSNDEVKAIGEIIKTNNSDEEVLKRFL